MLHWLALFNVFPIWFALWYLRRLEWWGFLFCSPLCFSQLCQLDLKTQFIKKLLSNSDYGISKTKDKLLTTTVIIFFINNKRRCTYFTPLMSGGSKKWNILKKIYSQRMLFILSIYELLLPPGMRVLTEGTESFLNF